MNTDTKQPRKIGFAELVRKHGDHWAIYGAFDKRCADDEIMSDALRSAAGLSAARSSEISGYLVMRYSAFRRSVM
jgi:hypothetical protein